MIEQAATHQDTSAHDICRLRQLPDVQLRDTWPCMIPTFGHVSGRGSGRLGQPVLISSVQQRAMGSGKPYRSFAWLKQSLLHGKLPLWAFLAVTGFLLLLLVSLGACTAAGKFFLPLLALTKLLR